jgi:hypothetical protein
MKSSRLAHLPAAPRPPAHDLPLLLHLLLLLLLQHPSRSHATLLPDERHEPVPVCAEVGQGRGVKTSREVAAVAGLDRRKVVVLEAKLVQ